MENQIRLFLFLALGALALMTWTAWQQDYGQPVAESGPAVSQSREPAAPGAPAPADSAETAVTQTPAADEQGFVTGATVHVVTDLFDIEIATRGGGIVGARLLQYDLTADNPAPFPLLRSDGGPLFIAQSGLVAGEGDAPDHRRRWQAKQTEYRLGAGQDQVVVPLVWQGPDGVTVTKRYTFTRDSYVIAVEHEVTNRGDTPWRAYQYTQLRRQPTPDSGGLLLFATRAYSGGAYYSPTDKFEKVPYDQMREKPPLSKDIADGWVAMIDHYFVAAWVPPRDVTARYYTRALDNNQYIIGMSLPWQSVAPETTATFHSQLYAGPKVQEQLDDVAAGLALTVDYGWLTIIAKPLFIILAWIHGVVGNWGWAIVLLTILIKAVFYKLSETSYRSMARMRKLQPRMQQLKERFGDDRQRMNQELMELYKREKVNPLGGCLPIVIQIPVFIALYWVLLGSVELRQAPWILWIDDLSTRDPYFVLPLIMGATMFLQQQLNPAPVDPIQKRVMTFLPLVFTVFFLFFPAGLVLYWVTNNSLSILQQWVITRRIERGDDSDTGGKKHRKKSNTSRG